MYMQSHIRNRMNLWTVRYAIGTFLLLPGLICCEYYQGPREHVCIEDSVEKTVLIHTLYADIALNPQSDAILIELLEHPAVQRLKHVRQYGPWYYAIAPIEYTRFDHSIGVFALVRKFGGSLTEQVAALLHDASHTAFSHTGGYFFAKSDRAADDYQDACHEEFLCDSGLEKTLNKYGYTVADIHHKNKAFTILEQKRPDINADRFEYIVSGGLWENLITREQAKDIIEDVVCAEGKWFFTDPTLAKRFADLSLYMTEYTWGSACSCYMNRALGHAMRRMAEKGDLAVHEVRFGRDDALWERLSLYQDKEVAACLEKVTHCKEIITSRAAEYDIVVYPKFRGVDPLVKTKNTYQRLSQINTEFAKAHDTLKQRLVKGLRVQAQA